MSDSRMCGTDSAVQELCHSVSYADTDAGGVVYHGRYIEMAERARNRLMRMAGFSFASLKDQHDVMLVMHKVVATYHAPAHLEDELRLLTQVPVCKRSRSVWVTEMRLGTTLLATIELQIVCLSVSARQIAPHPLPFVEALGCYADGWY